MDRKAVEILFQDYANMKPISAGIYKAVYESIAKGYLKSGDRVTIDGLAEICHTSRTPVREAVRQLVSKKILSFDPTIGYYVHIYTHKECREMLDVQKILQTAAIRLSADSITPLYIQMLEKNIEKSKNTKDTGELFRLNREFHIIIARSANNDYLVELIKKNYIQLFLYDYAKQPDLNIPQVIRQHEEILEALKNHDADKAVELYLDHSQNYENLLSWSLYAENSEFSKDML